MECKNKGKTVKRDIHAVKRAVNTYKFLLSTDDFIYLLLSSNVDYLLSKIEYRIQKIRLIHYVKYRTNADRNRSPRPSDFRLYLRLLGYDYAVKLEVFKAEGDHGGE